MSKEKLWLSEAMLQMNKKLKKHTLNIINSHAGSGKTKFIFDNFLEESYKYVDDIGQKCYISNLDRVLYVCDTTMLKSSVLQEAEGFSKILEKGDLIKAKKHYLDIILLYTGYMHNGFSDLTSFKKQLSYVENKIKKEHKMVKFIIDMHIPPQIGAFVKYSNHTLNSELTTEFIKFINKYQSRIIAITTHHIHNFNTSDFSLPVYIHPEGNIPIYLTSSGGNKDSNKHSKSQCKCLKMNFVTDKNKINLKDVEEIVL